MNFTSQTIWFAVHDIISPPGQPNAGEVIRKDHFVVFNSREDAIDQCKIWATAKHFNDESKLMYPEKTNFRVIKQTTKYEDDDALRLYFQLIRED